MHPDLLAHRLRVVKIAGIGTAIGVLAAVDGTLVAAIIGGCFTLANTILTIWLTDSRPTKRRSRRRSWPLKRRARRRSRPPKHRASEDER